MGRPPPQCPPTGFPPLLVTPGCGCPTYTGTSRDVEVDISVLAPLWRRTSPISAPQWPTNSERRWALLRLSETDRANCQEAFPLVSSIFSGYRRGPRQDSNPRTRLRRCTEWREPYHAESANRLTAEQRARLDVLEQQERSRDEEVECRTLCWLPDYGDPSRAEAWARAAASVPFEINWRANREPMSSSGWKGTGHLRGAGVKCAALRKLSLSRRPIFHERRRPPQHEDHARRTVRTEKPHPADPHRHRRGNRRMGGEHAGGQAEVGPGGHRRICAVPDRQGPSSYRAPLAARSTDRPSSGAAQTS